MYLCSDRTLLLAKYSTSIFLLPSQSASALTKYFHSWKFLASALRSLSAQGDETLVSRCALCNYCVASKTSDKWKENMEQSKANQSSLWVGERGQEQQRHRYLPGAPSEMHQQPTAPNNPTTIKTRQPFNNSNYINIFFNNPTCKDLTYNHLTTTKIRKTWQTHNKPTVFTVRKQQQTNNPENPTTYRKKRPNTFHNSDKKPLRSTYGVVYLDPTTQA